ncbi:hypothetical protein J6590_103661 [Homalodisca vitripennis]|nr:hypothetical protein J6590_103661 [Homalodisca vitripennis]
MDPLERYEYTAYTGTDLRGAEPGRPATVPMYARPSIVAKETRLSRSQSRSMDPLERYEYTAYTGTDLRGAEPGRPATVPMYARPSIVAKETRV